MKLAIRFALGMVGLVAVTLAAVDGVVFFRLKELLLPRELARLEAHTGAVAAEFENQLAGVRADLLVLSDLPEVKGFVAARASNGIDPQAELEESPGRGALDQALTSFASHNPSYVQLRIIGADDRGTELVRVDRSGPDGTVRTVAPSGLQAKGGRPYFSAAMQMGEGEVYVSPIELNREFGVIEDPPRPVVRVARPLSAQDGTRVGLLIVNVDLTPVLARVSAAAFPGGQIFLVNGGGEFLAHSDPDLTFGFDRGTSHRIYDEYPELAETINWRSDVVNIVTLDDGGKLGVAVRHVRPAGGDPVTLIEVLPEEQLLATVQSVWHSTILVGIAAVVCAGILALVLARSMTRPLTLMTQAVEGIGTGGGTMAPVAAGGEMGVLARAFETMRRDVQEKTSALEREVTVRREAELAAEKNAANSRMLGLIVENSNDPIIAKTLDGTITTWNPAAERVFGYNAEEAIGQNITLIVPPELRGEVSKTLATIARGERVDYTETTRITKDGRRIDVALTISPLRSPSGEVMGASKIARDITELKQAEKMFQLAVESSPSGMVIVDRSGIITLVNAETERLFGYARSELIGQPIDRLVPERFRTSHPGHFARFVQKPEARLMGEGRDLFGLRKDGTEFPVEIGLNPVETARGIHVIAAITDISARKMAEEQFRLAVDASPSGMVLVDRQGRITLVNAETERLFGYARSEMIGQPVDLLLPERFRAAHPGHLQGFVAHPEARPMGGGRELFGRRKDGTEFPVEIGLNPVRSHDGMRVIAAITDITARRAASQALERQAQELRRSNEELEQFAYVASHDLQEPLRMVASYTELLGERYQGKLDEKADKFIHYAVDGARRMQRLVNDLLAYSRFGRAQLEIREVDGNVLVKQVLFYIKDRITAADAQVTYGALPIVQGDESQLAQVFQNLVSNALKFRSEAPPKVHIDARLQNEMHVFSVSDNGIGIDTGDAGRLFQMFQRLHQRGKYEGSGIGLAIVKKIVENHGGKVWFESAPRGGSIFYFSIPAAARTGLA